MELSKLLSMLMYKVDAIEYFDKEMNFLYRFEISDVPKNCKDRIIKFNIYLRENKRILEVIEK